MGADLQADPRLEQRAQLRAAAAVVLGLAVVGALLGVVWQAWSPAGPFGIIYPQGVQPDETESWAAGDGRFAVLAAAAGLTAGVAAWLLRRTRGPYVALALAVGGTGGAALTYWVGHLIRGSAHTYSCFIGSDVAVKCTQHLPLSLHMRGLLLVEPVLALLVYGLCVAFAVRDDLGRPDPVRRRLASVGAGGDPEHGGRYGDGAGPLQHGDFPPQ